MESNAKWLENFTKYRRRTDEAQVIVSAIIHHLSKMKIKQGIFLDIGSGTGEITNVLAHRFTENLAVDQRAESKDYLNKKIHFYSTLEKIPKKKKVDFILLSFVMSSNLSKDKRLIQAAIRKLAPEGVICIVSLSGESLLEEGYRQYSSTVNFFVEQVLRTNNFSLEKSVVRSNYSIPKSETNLLRKLFAIKSVNKMMIGSYLDAKNIRFSLLHNILFARQSKKKKAYIFSGLVGVGKTTIAKEFARNVHGYYFNLDLFLRDHARRSGVDFEKYLIDITRYNRNVIAELLAKELDILSLQKGTIVLDGVFSPEEIIHLRSISNIAIIAIHIKASFSQRLQGVVNRQKMTKKRAMDYLKRLDSISREYGGGDYVPALFISQINNNGTEIKRIIQDFKKENRYWLE